MHPGRSIYHFTAIDNIPEILRSGALLADRDTSGLLRVEIGQLAIKERRRTLKVPLPPGGYPCDYVPFYFAPRSPMMYRISKGGVPQYQRGTEPLIYLTSTMHTIANLGYPFLFTDGNCASQLTDYFNDFTQLHQVDWEVMSGKWWHDTAEDPDRKRRRSAEFLVHKEVPLHAFQAMTTKTPRAAARLQEILDDFNYEIAVQIKPEWYY